MAIEYLTETDETEINAVFARIEDTFLDLESKGRLLSVPNEANDCYDGVNLQYRIYPYRAYSLQEFSEKLNLFINEIEIVLDLLNEVDLSLQSKTTDSDLELKDIKN